MALNLEKWREKISHLDTPDNKQVTETPGSSSGLPIKVKEKRPKWPVSVDENPFRGRASVTLLRDGLCVGETHTLSAHIMTDTFARQ